MYKLPKSTRIIEPPRVKRISNKTVNIDDDDTQDSSNNDVRDFIKQCVQEELNTISQSKNKKATRIIPPAVEKQKKLINQDKICDCGKDIGKMSNQQVEMHMRSKFHNENI
jgi:hypothetical protein